MRRDLVNLNDLLSRARIGTVVHIVSDDPTSDLEILRWSDQTGNEFLESRKEGNIYHFLVRKTNGSGKNLLFHLAGPPHHRFYFSIGLRTMFPHSVHEPS